MSAIANRLTKLERQAAKLDLTPDAGSGNAVDRLLWLIRNTYGNEPDTVAGNRRAFVFWFYWFEHLAAEMPDDAPDRAKVLATLEDDRRVLESWRWQSPGEQTMRELELVEMGVLDREFIGDRVNTDEWRKHENYLRKIGWLEKFARQRPAVEQCLAEIGAGR